MTPQRIQLRRTRGWRKPEGVVVVARPTKWGNPFTVASCIAEGFAQTEAEARKVCVDAFRGWLGENTDWDFANGSERRARILADIGELTGRDLACWCQLDQPCHADVLLRIANEDAIVRGRSVFA